MTPFISPAIEAWLKRPGDLFQLAEVQLRRMSDGFELRHTADAAAEQACLRTLAPEELREWAQFTAGGAFRPNKAAPGLRRGWRTDALTPPELEIALDALYPGAVADGYAVAQGSAVITSFRQFTGRQTGMYRSTGQLSDAQAASVIRAGCDAHCCLRQRLWSVEGLAPDASSDKSEIPCLEPCALLLEFARRAVRLEQEERIPLNLGAGELATLRAAVELALEHPDPAIREGDTSAPANPRRLLLLREKIAGLASPGNPPKEV